MLSFSFLIIHGQHCFGFEVFLHVFGASHRLFKISLVFIIHCLLLCILVALHWLSYCIEYHPSFCVFSLVRYLCWWWRSVASLDRDLWPSYCNLKDCYIAAIWVLIVMRISALELQKFLRGCLLWHGEALMGLELHTNLLYL